jgi:hypothetical protein
MAKKKGGAPAPKAAKPKPKVGRARVAELTAPRAKAGTRAEERELRERGEDIMGGADHE